MVRRLTRRERYTQSYKLYEEREQERLDRQEAWLHEETRRLYTTQRYRRKYRKSLTFACRRVRKRLRILKLATRDLLREIIRDGH